MFWKIKMNWIVLLLCIVLTSACGGGGGSGDESGSVDGDDSDQTTDTSPDTSTDTSTAAYDRNWTVMVYMGGDNNLSDAALFDLNEMEAVGSDDNMAIVAQYEFSAGESPSLPSTMVNTTFRQYIENDNNISSVNVSTAENIGNVNMGDEDSLSDFIEYAITNYPANNYALLIWSHGGGWKVAKANSRGAVVDDTSSSIMSLPDLADAVDSAETSTESHIAVINFDACLMGMYEVAYEFRGLTDYLVASEESIPGDGNPYDALLAALKVNPDSSASDLATLIVDSYYNYYSTQSRVQNTTISALDMSKIDSLDSAILGLASALMADATSLSVIQAAQENTQHYAYTNYHDLYDLSQYLVNQMSGYVETAAQAVMTAVTNMVVANKTTGDGVTKSNGIAIYLPATDETSDADLEAYAILRSNTARSAANGTWGKYIETLIATLGGSTQETSSNEFGVAITWTAADGTSACDADLDLYVSDPTTGNFYAPYMGSTTPNGYFSSDSAVSGSSAESFASQSTITSGDYYILINYFEDGSTCNQAYVTFYLYDPSAGYNDYTALASAYGDLSNPAPSDWSSLSSLSDLNDYSDWWYIGYLTRSLEDSSFSTDPVLVESLGKGVLGISLNKAFKD